MRIDNLNSTDSLKQLASYILKAANQPEILDDETTVTDSGWSSKKIQDELDALANTLDGTYVEVEQAVGDVGRYMQVVIDTGDEDKVKVLPKPMVFEQDNIDFNNF